MFDNYAATPLAFEMYIFRNAGFLNICIIINSFASIYSLINSKTGLSDTIY